jgi:hypothetical protein
MTAEEIRKRNIDNMIQGGVLRTILHEQVDRLLDSNRLPVVMLCIDFNVGGDFCTWIHPSITPQKAVAMCEEYSKNSKYKRNAD